MALKVVQYNMSTELPWSTKGFLDRKVVDIDRYHHWVVLCWVYPLEIFICERNRWHPRPGGDEVYLVDDP